MSLFEPGRIGALTLANRIVMAPLGRARNDVPTREAQALSARYYSQRASAGLIITEATHVSPGSVSRPGTGAIHSDGQIAGWRQVTDAVHAQGGRIFQQIVHLGRKANPDLLGDGYVVVAPSAIAARGSVPIGAGQMKPFPVPHALTLEGIAAVQDAFGKAFENAVLAGFDGVELHGANGFLIEQFLRDDANRRTDRYGGSIENRARFLLELVDAASAILGPDRVGVRLSPHFVSDGSGSSDYDRLYPYVARELGKRGIAYLHLIEPDDTAPERKLAPVLRTAFGGPFILAGGFDRDRARQAIEEDRADFIAFGRLYIANPDLVARLRLAEPVFNEPDEASFYVGGEKGFVDYPFLPGSAEHLAEAEQFWRVVDEV
ncbi:12-oxophytodienoate reductase [Sphingobium chlorophenolicum L-1]|uniref:12-oxophytodienoate reductase n=1 Tax=Sphingobium chlorophenolicum L-1 TaxID=690566 RepID=F6F3L5_SPHCR|nr:alkene reductase [Sphingobium chlorophenolicum]AEG51027.1 12-oxophytodienoate reductase [Sphingobium chlorophenolicum L-1]